MPEYGLGRLPPKDLKHEEQYPLTASTIPRVPTPVVLGTDWHTGMDEPVVKNDGSLWLFPTGPVRGGHSYCLEPPKSKCRDIPSWWGWYNQGSEGACVAFAISRQQSLCNRQRYSPWELYKAAQLVDEWAGENYEGTSVRAGYDVAREQGLWVPFHGDINEGRGPILKHGIAANRWARNVEDIAACLSPEDNGKMVMDAGYVTVLNSWGKAFPHRVRMGLEVLRELVFNRGGEAGIPTDR